MLKKRVCCMIVSIVSLTLVLVLFSGGHADAQSTRSIVPSPRVTVDAIDPTTGMTKSSFCTGPNTIDVKISNGSGYGQFVSIINRDTRGVERTLFSGQLPTGTSYLSRLLGTQLALTGPAGTETLRVVMNGSSSTSGQVSYYVQECGGSGSGGGWPGYGYAQVWAQVAPYAIEQGKKGMIYLQASVGAQSHATYYFEILNSWGQLWKRIPITKQPHERYQVTLPVGAKTKTGRLTYTVNILMEPAFGGQSQKIGSSRFSFMVVTPGSGQSPYNPGYPGYPMPYQGYQDYQGYPGAMPYGADPYSGMGMPGYGMPQSYMPSPYSSSPSYGVSPMGGPVGERQIQ